MLVKLFTCHFAILTRGMHELVIQVSLDLSYQVLSLMRHPMSLMSLIITYQVLSQAMPLMRHPTSLIKHLMSLKISYGVATVSSIDNIIALFCRISSFL